MLILRCNTEYPCNDKSSGVTDFHEWKYFKDRRELLKDKKVISMQRTHIWCDDLIDRVNRQNTYLEDIIQEKKEKLANTPLNKVNLEYRMRIQRAKAAAGRYSRAGSVVSKAVASQGTAMNANKKNQPKPKKESFVMKTKRAAVEEQVRRDKSPGKERVYTSAPATSPSRSRPNTYSNATSRTPGGRSTSPNKNRS